jgi:hypothetical protein
MQYPRTKTTHATKHKAIRKKSRTQLHSNQIMHEYPLYSKWRMVASDHECHISLNRKCRNTHFTLIEQQSIRKVCTPHSLLNLYTSKERGLSFEGKLSSLAKNCVSLFLPKPLVFIGEEFPRVGMVSPLLPPLPTHHPARNSTRQFPISQSQRSKEPGENWILGGLTRAK